MTYSIMFHYNWYQSTRFCFNFGLIFCNFEILILSLGEEPSQWGEGSVVNSPPNLGRPTFTQTGSLTVLLVTPES
jgi:hypothetical protein